jgi:hypothetical protein
MEKAEREEGLRVLRLRVRCQRVRFRYSFSHGGCAADLSSLNFSLDPKAESQELFADACDLRDYFYDAFTNGLAWKAMHAKYEPLVQCVTDRACNSTLGALIVLERSYYSPGPQGVSVLRTYAM